MTATPPNGVSAPPAARRFLPWLVLGAVIVAGIVLLFVFGQRVMPFFASGG